MPTTVKLDATAWRTTVDSTEPPTVKPPRMSGIVAWGSVNQTSMPLCVVSAAMATRNRPNTTPSAMSAGNARRYGPSGACASTTSQQIPMTSAT